MTSPIFLCENLGNTKVMTHEQFCNRLFTKSIASFNKKDILRTMSLKRVRLGFKDMTASESELVYGIIFDELMSYNWDVEHLALTIHRLLPNIDINSARRIARTESQVIANKAREYEFKRRHPQNSLYIWNGPSDERTSQMCIAIKARQPSRGSSLEDLKDLVKRTSHEYGNTLNRDWSTHPNCRHYVMRIYD